MDNFKNGAVLRIEGHQNVEILRHTNDGMAYLLDKSGEEEAIWCGFPVYDKEEDTWVVRAIRFITYIKPTVKQHETDQQNESA